MTTADLGQFPNTPDDPELTRKLTDKIACNAKKIKEEIERQGYSEFTVDGKTFRMARLTETGSA